MFEALAIIRDRHHVSIPLVMSGRPYPAYQTTVDDIIKRLNLSDQVIQLGPVSERVLCALYDSARFLVFPSLFEGLGMPIIEAMMHGLPILASSETCIPEVVGNAAQLFNALDVDDMARSIYRAWTDREWITDPAQNARTQLDRFNWINAAKQFNACYDLVLNPTTSRAIPYWRDRR